MGDPLRTACGGADAQSPSPEGGPPLFLKSVGGRLREARIKRGLSQKQLGLQAGINQPDVSRIEGGKKNITLLTLARLFRVLGIDRLDLD